MWEYLKKSTLKREFASSLMYWLLAMATYLIFKAPTWDQAYRLASDFLLPTFAMAAAAFGLEYFAKQTNFGGPPQGDGGKRDGDAPRDGDNPPNGNGNP